MDGRLGREHGIKPGMGGLASKSRLERERKENLEKLTLQTFDVSGDPYLYKTHLGQFECKLCHTLHLTLGSYITHTQGKKHTSNIRRRALVQFSKEPDKPNSQIKKKAIGKPGFTISHQKDEESNLLSFDILLSESPKEFESI